MREVLHDSTISDSFRDLLIMLREDLSANLGNWTGAGFHALVIYRLGKWGSMRRGLTRSVVQVVYSAAFVFIRNIYGIELQLGASIGRGLWLPHPAGIFVGDGTEIGNHCLIRQSVSIGHFAVGPSENPVSAPRVGHGVEVGAGAVISGGITIGDRARIGPNTVVLTDIPPGGTVTASQARVLKPLLDSPVSRSGAGGSAGADASMHVPHHK
jgi:serine O-acetyltransferase